MPTQDPFKTVREQAQKALDVVLREIKEREAELESLARQAEQWRAAISGAPAPSRSSAKSRSTTRRGAKRGSGKRVSWDNVLAGLPKKFTVDDIMKRPGVKARGRAQVYPAITRWMDGKKVKRVGTGTYEKR